VKHFLNDMRDRERASKRGGGVRPERLTTAGGTTGAGFGHEPADPEGFPPDSAFDRTWALTLLSRALATLSREHDAAGKRAVFETLKSWLTGASPGLSQAEAALRLGSSEGAVKVAVHRLRKRFRELIEAEIAQTVDDPGQIREELRYLIEVVS
jgi:RNA polymerase sigma-70 factor (ECF subfamily)